MILIRGGGDLATGVAIRLVRAGLRVAVLELPQPLVVRRTVSFAEAVYAREVSVEGYTARCVTDSTDTLLILSIFGKQQVPVIIDPDCQSAKSLHPAVIVDGRMTKKPPEPIGYVPSMYIGLGPGFSAGGNCQAVVETRRGHTLGRVYYQGSPLHDTGLPDGDPARVIRAPQDGIFTERTAIGSRVEQGQVLAEIVPDGGSMEDRSPIPVTAPFSGTLRGLIHSGLRVTRGLKIGDIDQQNGPEACQLVSDKALAVGGGVLEAILSRPELRAQLWT
jgi:xanthine dehydrogenase accessory factor